MFLMNSIKSSGTTWLQEIVWQIYHNGEISKERIEKRYAHFEKTQLLPRPGDEPEVALSSRPSPRLIKSHLPYHVVPISESEANRSKYIYVARNPKDVAVSYYKFVSSFGPASHFNGTLDFFANLLADGKGMHQRFSLGLYGVTQVCKRTHVSNVTSKRRTLRVELDTIFINHWWHKNTAR